MRPGEAEAWAQVVLTSVGTLYPWASQLVVTGPQDTDADPKLRHPAFCGSFDWHSSVHMLWSGLTLLDLAADDLHADTAAALRGLLDERLRRENVLTETAVLRSQPGFERPYGRAWALRLIAQAVRSGEPGASAWSEALEPLGEEILGGVPSWLASLDHPVRAGGHENTAFGLTLMRDASLVLDRQDVVAAIDGYAHGAFAGDRDYPAAWEPGGHDFLSPALAEATLMRRVLPDRSFTAWLATFLPGLGQAGDVLLATPAVRDPSDGKRAHLLGLSLSRAWHLSELVGHVDPDRARRLGQAAHRMRSAVAGHVTGGDFMATHWLVSFALSADLAAQSN